MNKLAIALSAALSLGAAASASAQDATINFTGNITAAACAIDITGDAASSTVTMRTVTADGLKTKNPGHRSFNVVVGDGTVAGCPGNTAELIIDSTNVNSATGNLKNTHVDPGSTDPAAVGVEVRILDDADAAIKLGADTIEAKKGADNKFTYKFQAIYHVEDHDLVEAGKFTSALPFILSHY